jgi:hypothetical protein
MIDRQAARLPPERVLALIASWPEWVLSRSERLEWSTTEIVSVTAVVEFVLPSAAQASESNATVYLPFTTIPKDSAVRTDVTDEAGARLATLPFTESNQITVDALLDGATQTAPSLRGDERFARLIAEIVQTDPYTSVASLRALEEHVANTPLATDHFFRSLVDVLARDYLLVAALNDPDRPHRVITYRYDMPWTIRRGIRQIPAMLGWTATAVYISFTLGRAAAYEAEISAPNGTYLSWVQLIDIPRAGARAVTAFVSPRSVRLAVAGPQPSLRGSALLRLFPDRSYIAGVVITAVFAAAILTAGRFRLHAIKENVDATTTLLLAGPTLFSALVARVGRARPGAQLITVARAILLLTGVLTFIAAGTLVTTNGPPRLLVIWDILLAAAWLASGVLLPGALRPSRSGLPRRGP